MISLAGPLANILFFAIFFIVYRISENTVVLNFSLINLLFAVFNLLPIKELDGGLILYKLSAAFTGENRARIILNFVSLVTGVALLLLGIWIFLLNKNFSIIILSIYILLSVLIKL
jgi:Zn-dependent protease